LAPQEQRAADEHAAELAILGAAQHEHAQQNASDEQHETPAMNGENARVQLHALALDPLQCALFFRPLLERAGNGISHAR
jgi:hypothetical protein